MVSIGAAFVNVLRKIGWAMIVLAVALMALVLTVASGLPGFSGGFVIVPLILGIKGLLVTFVIGVVLADHPHGAKRRSYFGAAAIVGMMALVLFFPASKNPLLKDFLEFGTRWIPFAAALAALLIHAGLRDRVFSSGGNPRLNMAWGVFLVCCFGTLINGGILIAYLATGLVVMGAGSTVIWTLISMAAAGYALLRINPVSPLVLAAIMLNRIDSWLVPKTLGRFLGGHLDSILPLAVLCVSLTCSWLLLAPVVKAKLKTKTTDGDYGAV